MPFHTIPEIWYGNAWHMLDPDHQVFYRKDDGTIASVVEVIANPNLVARTADSNGRDPVGWPAASMAQLYAENGPALRYAASGFYLLPPSNILLRPHESLIFQSENTADFVHFSWPGPGYTAPLMTSVSSAQFDWMLSFGDPSWRSQALTYNGVDVVADSSGKKWLANTSSGTGYIQYQQGSPFPVSSLVISAQLAPASGGSLRVSFMDGDGGVWSNPVTFQPITGMSSFNVSADLTALVKGYYSYYLRIELVGDVQVHKLRITPGVQTAKALFPTLAAGTVNHLSYSDESPQSQARSMQVTVAIPSGKAQIRGGHAESLVPESPAYSLSRDYGAANLVDGDPDSLAYPGSVHLDYVIQLNGTYQVSGISMDWNNFGTQAQYVKSWQVLGRSGNQPWQQLAQGGFPGAPTLDVPLNATLTEVRIVADGNNWIGIYEARIFGNAVAPSLPSSLLTAYSNVPEDPLYSIARHYQASNLVDGDTATLA